MNKNISKGRNYHYKSSFALHSVKIFFLLINRLHQSISSEIWLHCLQEQTLKRGGPCVFLFSSRFSREKIGLTSHKWWYTIRNSSVLVASVKSWEICKKYVFMLSFCSGFDLFCHGCPALCPPESAPGEKDCSTNCVIVVCVSSSQAG